MKTSESAVDDVDVGDDVAVSKYLSLVLRHRPQDAGLTLDEQGWVDVDDLLAGIAPRCPIDRGRLERIVVNSDKRRFQLQDGRIRAHQGHSVPVRLEWPVTAPPPVLFHGTPERFVAPILAEGLVPKARHDVHLSADRETAEAVGARRGRAVVLRIDAAGMVADGLSFRCTDNGVWLTSHVPARYLRGD